MPGPAPPAGPSIQEILASQKSIEQKTYEELQKQSAWLVEIKNVLIEAQEILKRAFPDPVIQKKTEPIRKAGPPHHR